MTKTKRGVGGSFTSCFDKTLCFCVMQRVFCEHLDSLPGFMEPENLHIYFVSYQQLLLHYDGDLVTRTDCGPEYAACATQHRDRGYMLDTCYGSCPQRCNGAGHLIPVKCQLCFSWNQFHTQTTRLSRDMSPHIVIMFMLFECGFARINRRPIRRYNLPGRPGVPKLPDTEVERYILSDLRQL